MPFPRLRVEPTLLCLALAACHAPRPQLVERPPAASVPAGTTLPGLDACVSTGGRTARCDTDVGALECAVGDRAEPPRAPYLVCSLDAEQRSTIAQTELGMGDGLRGFEQVVVVPAEGHARILTTRAEFAHYMQLDSSAAALAFVLAIESRALIGVRLAKGPVRAHAVAVGVGAYDVRVFHYQLQGCTHPLTERVYRVTSAGGMTLVRKTVLADLDRGLCAD